MADQLGLVDRFPVFVYKVMEFCVFIRKFAPNFFDIAECVNYVRN